MCGFSGVSLGNGVGRGFYLLLMYSLTYIYHDCFLLECQDCAVVFDYWRDPLSESQEIPDFVKSIRPQKPLYVLVSHFHKDHFNKSIFGWRDLHPQIHFVISPDVRKRVRYLLEPDSHYAGQKVPQELVSALRKGEMFSDALVDIHAFGSTDIGNSYVVKDKRSGLKVFHAGDLNCWAFRDNSTPAEIRSAENAFHSELAPIAEDFPELDVAMFPVDSRIGSCYAYGAAEFLKRINVKCFFPMHFTLGETPDEIERRRRDAVDFSRYASTNGEYVALTKSYDRYLKN